MESNIHNKFSCFYNSIFIILHDLSNYNYGNEKNNNKTNYNDNNSSFTSLNTTNYSLFGHFKP